MLTVSRGRTWWTRWTQEAGIRLGETPNLRPEFGATGYGGLDLLARICHAAARRYEIVHMFDHKPNATLPGFLNRSLYGGRLIADWADWWGGAVGALNDRPHRFPALHRFEDWWEIQSKLRADGVVTISQVLEKRALDIGCDGDRVLYIPTGAPLNRIWPVPQAEARAQIGFTATEALIGFVGISQDDLEILFDALRQLPQVRLLLIGPVWPAVQQLAQQFEVLDRVIFAGRIHGQELNTYLACTDVLCLPMKDTAYNRGRLPNKLLDYLAAGRPVVASPVGDVKSIFEKYQVGVLAGTLEFAANLQNVLGDPQLCREMGSRAREVAKQHFDWNNLAERLEDFYFGLVSRS